ncbi:hypothetical protein D9M73_276660 [compost metagenome]
MRALMLLVGGAQLLWQQSITANGEEVARSGVMERQQPGEHTGHEQEADGVGQP